MALSLNQVYYAVSDRLYEQDHWLVDLYTDGGESTFYAISSSGGKLFRHEVVVDNNTREIAVGEAVEVEHTFTPTERTRIIITRTADGKRRWTMIAATSVLNRVAEIDSRDLFDDFIANVEKEGYPYLTLLHCDETYRMGQADLLHREGDVYINSGTFDEEGENAELATAVADMLETDSEGWGVSIGYRPRALPDMVEIASGVHIPVYRKGVHIESSLLFESDAANLFTAVSVERANNRMTQKLREHFMKIFDGDEAKVELWLEKVGETQRSIDTNGLITRGGTEEPAPAADPVVAEEEAPEELDAEIVISDEVMAEIVSQVTAQVQAQLAAANERIAAQDALIATLTRELDTERKARQALEARLQPLEQDEAGKQERYQQDLPRSRKQMVITRPRQPEPEETPAGAVDLATAASKTRKAVKPKLSTNQAMEEDTE